MTTPVGCVFAGGGGSGNDVGCGKAATPSVVALSMKVTVPLGTPAALLTVAVKLTLWPNTDGSVEEVTVVVVPDSTDTMAGAVKLTLRIRWLYRSAM